MATGIERCPTLEVATTVVVSSISPCERPSRDAASHVPPCVSAGLSVTARLFDTGHNRKTDAHDARAVAAVAVRAGLAGAVLRRRARGAADARQPPRGTHPSQGPDGQPA